jgi:hypothetical protein
MVLANIARIVIDTSADPTSHSLFPFELAITLVVGVALTATGCVAGALLDAVFRRTG